MTIPLAWMLFTNKTLDSADGDSIEQPHIPKLSFCLENLPKSPLTVPRVCINFESHGEAGSWLFASVVILGERAFGLTTFQHIQMARISGLISGYFHEQTTSLVNKWLKLKKDLPEAEKSRLIENLVALWFLATSEQIRPTLAERRNRIESFFSARFFNAFGHLMSRMRQVISQEDDSFEITSCFSELGYLFNSERKSIDSDHRSLENAIKPDALNHLTAYAQQILERLLTPQYFIFAFRYLLCLDALARLKIEDSHVVESFINRFGYTYT